MCHLFQTELIPILLKYFHRQFYFKDLIIEHFFISASLLLLSPHYWLAAVWRHQAAKPEICSKDWVSVQNTFSSTDKDWK